MSRPRGVRIGAEMPAVEDDVGEARDPLRSSEHS